MSVRRISLTARAACLVALGALALCAPPASASFVPEPGGRADTVRAPHCSLKGARTIAANRRVRVFSAPTGPGRHPRLEVYGCRRTANRAYAIGDRGAECQNYDLIDTVVVAGDFAALNVRSCTLYDTYSVVKLISLRDGRVRSGSAPLTSLPAPGARDAIRGMVVTADGELAWLGVRLLRGGVVAAEVCRPAPGAARQAVLLDSGTDIDPRSLRRRGTRALWRKAGAERSARIPSEAAPAPAPAATR